MESLVVNLTYVFLFAYFANRLSVCDYKMLCVRVKKYMYNTFWLFAFSSVLFAAPAYADTAAKDTGLFNDLITKGAEIFTGVRDIVFVVSGFGIIGVAVGGFFGNMNWKWLGAIIIGLMVVGLTGSIIQFVAGDSAGALKERIKDSLV